MLTIGVITGCKDENASMYVVTETPQVVESKPTVQDEFEYIEAQVADDANTDVSLGKKRIVEINGQPIAKVVSEYVDDKSLIEQDTQYIETDDTNSSAEITSVQADTDLDLDELKKWIDKSDYDTIYESIEDMCEVLGVSYSGALETTEQLGSSIKHLKQNGMQYKIDADTYFWVTIWEPQDDNTYSIEELLANLKSDSSVGGMYDLNISDSGEFIYGTFVPQNADEKLGTKLLECCTAISLMDKHIYGQDNQK
jgi:hypothetical protein